MTGTTWEARAPKSILEYAASMLSVQGVQPDYVPTTNPEKIRSSDWALGICLAGDMQAVEMLCLRAKWLGDPDAISELSDRMAKSIALRVGEDHRMGLAVLAVREYCHGPISAREICRTLKISRPNTWPKMEGAYRKMVSQAHSHEASLGRKLREIMG